MIGVRLRWVASAGCWFAWWALLPIGALAAENTPVRGLLAEIHLHADRTLLQPSVLTLRVSGELHQLRLQRAGDANAPPVSVLWLIGSEEADAIQADVHCVANAGEPRDAFAGRRWSVVHATEGGWHRAWVGLEALAGDAAPCAARVLDVVERLARELSTADLLRVGTPWTTLRVMLAAPADVLVDGRFFPAGPSVLEIPVREGRHQLSWWLAGEDEPRRVEVRADGQRTTAVRLYAD